VTVTMDRRVFVSSWGGSWVSEFIPDRHGLDLWHRIRVGRHPSAILMSPGNLRLYATSAASDQIAVVNMVTRGMPDRISGAAPGAPSEGSTPNALAFSPSGDRLYVAEADNNAVAVYSTQGKKAGKLLGRIPVEWYPTAVLARGDSLWVLNGKGKGTGPNPELSQPGRRKKNEDPHQYTLGQTSGTLTLTHAPAESELAALSARVTAANRC